MWKIWFGSLIVENQYHGETGSSSIWGASCPRCINKGMLAKDWSIDTKLDL